ncbi:acyltransferase [Escherichia coli]|uniref:acyltransferase family protein n=2 Tax=Escherichia coli TaxID=562 RepID=UPI001C04E04A|nr:acyltransferase [Escherichia coli]MBU0055123.1 acyltransferase [Escherichia coli]MBU0155424.1 acyltransferase [Escherichia coli]MBU0181845.1 acyltransferase [Escherichia coli]MBU0253778.1 acyltransferase [Escherichia coli]MCF1943014.1 acyltransferase [Escherichia coli]
MNGREHRNNCFDIIRLFAAIIVIISHQYSLSGLTEPTFLGMTTLGGLGVIIFFAISGFLITKSCINSERFDLFLLKRVRRIFPALIPCSIFMYLVLGVYLEWDSLDEYISFSILKNILNVITLQGAPAHSGIFNGFIHPYSLNDSLWTLPLEFTCYLILGCIVFLSKNTLRVILITFIALLFISIYFLFNKTDIIFYGIVLQAFPVRALSFFTGAIMALTLNYWYNKRCISYLLIISTIVLMAVAYKNEINVIGYINVAIITIAIGHIFKDNLIAGRFDYSYGVYIYSFPIQQIIINKLTLGFFEGTFISIVVSLIFGCFSWHIVESKFIIKNKKIEQYSKVLSS